MFVILRKGWFLYISSNITKNEVICSLMTSTHIWKRYWLFFTHPNLSVYFHIVECILSRRENIHRDLLSNLAWINTSLMWRGGGRWTFSPRVINVSKFHGAMSKDGQCDERLVDPSSPAAIKCSSATNLNKPCRHTTQTAKGGRRVGGGCPAGWCHDCLTVYSMRLQIIFLFKSSTIHLSCLPTK